MYITCKVYNANLLNHNELLFIDTPTVMIISIYNENLVLTKHISLSQQLKDTVSQYMKDDHGKYGKF